MASQLSPIKTKRYRKLLNDLGWRFNRIRGDHEIWIKDGIISEIVFICNEKEVPPFIIRQNNKTLNLSTKEYLELLHRKKSKKST